MSLTKQQRFSLTSAPEEDYLSVHLQCSNEFSRAFAASMGCTISQTKSVVGIDDKACSRTVDSTKPRECIPQIYVGGPYGSTAGNVFNSEITILVGVGAGVSPFASILKSIWYRINHPRQTTRLKKVYFFWICHDFESFEWFRSLLMAIEFQDLDSHIEIYPACIHQSVHHFLSRLTSIQYLTASFDEAEATKNMINSTVYGSDLVTGLRAPTRHGHPDWDEIFSDIAEIHAPNNVNVFFSGPPSLSADLEHECKLASTRSAETGFLLNFKGSDF